MARQDLPTGWPLRARKAANAASGHYLAGRLTDRAGRSQQVRRTLHAKCPAVQHVRIHHRRRDVLVTEQLLHRANVIAAFQQMRGETVPLMPRAG